MFTIVWANNFCVAISRFGLLGPPRECVNCARKVIEVERVNTEEVYSMLERYSLLRDKRHVHCVNVDYKTVEPVVVEGDHSGVLTALVTYGKYGAKEVD
jgi:hypothetical protein